MNRYQENQPYRNYQNRDQYENQARHRNTDQYRNDYEHEQRNPYREGRNDYSRPSLENNTRGYAENDYRQAPDRYGRNQDYRTGHMQRPDAAYENRAQYQGRRNVDNMHRLDDNYDRDEDRNFFERVGDGIRDTWNNITHRDEDKDQFAHYGNGNDGYEDYQSTDREYDNGRYRDNYTRGQAAPQQRYDVRSGYNEYRPQPRSDERYRGGAENRGGAEYRSPRGDYRNTGRSAYPSNPQRRGNSNAGYYESQPDNTQGEYRWDNNRQRDYQNPTGRNFEL